MSRKSSGSSLIQESQRAATIVCSALLLFLSFGLANPTPASATIGVSELAKVCRTDSLVNNRHFDVCVDIDVRILDGYMRGHCTISSDDGKVFASISMDHCRIYDDTNKKIVVEKNGVSCTNCKSLHVETAWIAPHYVNYHAHMDWTVADPTCWEASALNSTEA